MLHTEEPHSLYRSSTAITTVTTVKSRSEKCGWVVTIKDRLR